MRSGREAGGVSREDSARGRREQWDKGVSRGRRYLRREAGVDAAW